MFYYATTKTPLVELVKVALIEAKRLGMDALHTTDSMENMKFLEVYLSDYE